MGNSRQINIYKNNPDMSSQDQKQEKTSTEPTIPKRLTVFVSGLNYHTTEEEILKFFSGCGKIERINVAKKEGTANNQGFCHIIYADAEGYNNALAMNGTELEGRYLDIIAAKGPTKIEKIKEKLKSSNNITLFVRNIPYDTNETEITELFSKYGQIKGVRLPKCRDNAEKLKGICFIDFENPKDMIGALELDGFSLRGRYLKLDADISYDDATGTKIKNKNGQNQLPMCPNTLQQMQAAQQQEYMMWMQQQQQMHQQWAMQNANQNMYPQQNMPNEQNYNMNEGYHMYNNEYNVNNEQINVNQMQQAFFVRGPPGLEKSKPGLSRAKNYQEFVPTDMSHVENDNMMFDTSKFANLSKRDYPGSQIISSGIAQNTSEQKTEKREHRSSSDIDVFINPKEKLNSLISPEMQKELEDFRMTIASRTRTNRKDTGGD